MRKGTSNPAVPISFFFFLASNILVPEMVMTQTTPVNVGVVLDLGTRVGMMGLRCIEMALSDFYAAHGHYKTRLSLNVRDSKEDVVGAAAAALELIKEAQVQAIMGPSTSMQANFVIDLGQKAQVPIITFSATSPSLTSIKSPYFYVAAQNDATQVNAVSAIVHDFRWRQAVPIYTDNEYGKGVIPYLIDALQKVGVRVPYWSVISPSASEERILEELYKLMTMSTRVFILHMIPPLGHRLLTKAKEIGMMKEGYVWIMTDGMTDFLNSPDPLLIDSMQGVLGVKPYVPKTKELENFRVRWKRRFQQDNNQEIMDSRLKIYGVWSYDTAMALAMAVEKAGTTNTGFQMANVAGISSTDLEKLGVSQYGPDLLQALSNISFKGLAGDFRFVNGQLPSATFQIVNVNDNGARGIGFWTPKKGLVKRLKSMTNTSTYTTSNYRLAPVTWPGDSTSVPKGWEVPTNGKKLRVGVPVKTGFNQFVKVTKDPGSNSTTVTGYCIDVFNAVIEALPYAVTYEYIPFAKPNGESAGTYNDLVYQVYLGIYDVAVGDITIIANRSSYVDFALPYKESGISMIVPIKDKKSKNAWVFLTPLTWDLWVTSFCFFVFIGFVVWVLEHRINEDFRGSPSQQAGTSFWFSFSTMVFAHREKVVSNLARVVVVVWCFVVLILTQAYTASLTSLLTVQQLQPTVTDVNELIKKGEYVGYLSGCFVSGILKRIGFEESKLMAYNSPEECDELLSKGSENGGIAAAFEETPYMKLFLAKYCPKYTTVEPTFKINGFGFAFPKGSPLMSDVSRAILQVTEGDKMKRIEEAWFGKQTNCSDSISLVSNSSCSLSLKSFWGLFLIAGLASIFGLLIFLATFLYEHRNVWMPSDSKISMWSRISNLFTIFIQKDLKSHSFRNESNERSGSNLPRVGVPSPSSYSTQTDFPVDSPSTECGAASINGQELHELFVHRPAERVLPGFWNDEANVNSQETQEFSFRRQTERVAVETNTDGMNSTSPERPTEVNH